MKKTQRVLRQPSRVLRAGFSLLLLLGLMTQPGAWAVPGDIAGGPGDEPDGFVGIADLNRVLGTNWNQSCTPGDWTMGDISGDGYVGIEDLNIVLGHFNQSDPDPFLGPNVGKVVYWNSTWAFVDVMKMARPWLVNWNPLGSQYIDANGWPTQNPSGQTVFTHVFDKISGHYPVGDYILTWECDDPNPNATDEVSAQGNGSGNVSETTDPNNRRRKVVTVIPDNQGIRINVNNINPQYPIYNIRLWMPGFENATSPFHPLFVSRLRPFKVLRFMDWQQTNSSSVIQWSDRKTSTYAFQNENTGGIALEYIIQLCNERNADAWFCMPHQADDNYVTQFAQYVKANLHANATIYVEWSNEVWNAGFGSNSQYNWVKNTATARYGPPPPPKSTFELGDQEFYRVWAEEAANDFTIWKSVFAGDSRQIVRVAAGFKDTPDVTQKLVARPEWLDPADPNGKDVLFDAISCSTYLSSKTGDSTGGYDPNNPPVDPLEAILDYTIDHKIPLIDPDTGQSNSGSATQFYNAHALLVRELSDPNYAQDNPDKYTGRAISFVSYEGGQHFVPNDNPSVLKLQINGSGPIIGFLLQRHPRMYEAYVANMRAFVTAGGADPQQQNVYPWGGKLFMAYTSVGKFEDKDTFGHYEFQDESINDAPKHRALIGGGGR